jgi:hypothetical protein
MALDPGVIDSVTNSNFKVVAEMGTLDALSHTKRLNIMAETALGQILNSMNQSTVSVPQGLGLQAAEGGALPGLVSSLGAAVAALQQLVKGAQTTPPPTGTTTKTA